MVAQGALWDAQGRLGLPLVSDERTRNQTCGPVLFELLNAMDGLAEDADILFLLTTNRADLPEPALAARPGRVDMAVEVPAT